MDQIISLFKKFDKDFSGTISRKEFFDGYKEIYGNSMTDFEIQHEVDMMWHNIDIDGSGLIDFTEF